MELRKSFRFEASHVLPRHPGKCSRLHGHSWVLHVSVQGEINPQTGFVQDYADISAAVKPIIEMLDHHHLGTWTDADWGQGLPMYDKWGVPGLSHQFYPTSENLLCWIALQLNILDVYQVLGGDTPRIVTTKPGQVVDYESYERVKRVSWWSKVELEETCTSLAILGRGEFDGRQQ